ncbi:hypothetical protein RND71_041113 [Anisodus tanguticus]|uniref:C2 domain-containing protein n=1 Tax=Anisodus tanguticus TaxID=243964 RepID=A0AAE1QUB0_9SOLA|nr:hypothetical protein RND71_041113 [Anisodus tanguticus]
MDWRPFDVTVISAAGIKNVNYFSTMDVYVEVSILGYAKNTKRTFIDKKGGTSPKWNYTMKFTLDEPSLTKPGLSLCFRLRSDRLFGNKDIGIVSIPMNEIFGQSACGPDGSPEKVVDYQVFTHISPYPYAQTGANNMPPPGMGYGTLNPNQGMAYQQPPTGYTPAGGYNGGGYQPGVYSPAGYPPAGYGYPPQQQVYGGYPPVQQVQKPQKKSNLGGMGAGVGLGLAGGLLGGMLVGEMVSDVGDDMDAYDQGYDDAMDYMDY